MVLAPRAGLAATPRTAVDIARFGAVAHGTPACQSCHGAMGEGQASTKTPRLAGLDAGYLERQLDLFAKGTRRSLVMGGVARTLHDDERASIADYYSKLPAKAAAGPPGGNADVKRGASLAMTGRWEVDVPPCSACHGVDGLGVGSVAPALAAQSAGYIEAQLKGWRAGDRHGDPLGLMAGIAKRLTRAEIKAVATYYAARPLSAPLNPSARTPGR
mgnify:CR=1 FL=1